MNSLFKLFAVILVVVSSIGGVSADDSAFATSQPSGNSALDEARLAIKANDWKKALVSLNLALKEEPRNADVHNLLGYSYRKQASPNLPKAFEHYNIALKLVPIMDRQQAFETIANELKNTIKIKSVDLERRLIDYTLA